MTINGSVVQSRSALPVGPPEINGVTEDGGIIRKAAVKHTMGMHSVGMIEITTPERDIERLKKAPIFFEYGTYPSFGYFWGYIQRIEKLQPFQSQVVLRLGAIGATWKMRVTTPKMWANTKASTIIQEKARNHGFGTYIPEYDYVFPRFAQTNDTDWGVLRSISRSIGRNVFAHNGVLRVINIVDELDRNKSVLTLEKSTQILEPRGLDLLGFEAIAEEDSDPADKKMKFSYFDTSGNVRTNDLGDVPEEDKIQQTEFYVPNEATARLINTTQEHWDSLGQKAIARIRGNAYLQPGMVVGISTGVPYSSVTDSMDGLWFVHETKHEITEEVNQTELKLIRDEYRPLTDARYEVFDGSKKPAPDMMLEEEEWVSTWR